MKSLIYIYLGLLLFNSCKEVPPKIDYTDVYQQNKDTTYINPSVPNNQLTNVLIEDITGVKCPNCPKAATVSENLRLNYKGRVFTMAIYPKSLSNLTKPYPQDTFTSDISEMIYENVYERPSALPAGGVNRKKFPGFTTINHSYNEWKNSAESELTQYAPLQIALNIKSIDVDKAKGVLSTKITLTDQVTDDIYFSLFITEDSIISPQSSSSGEIEHYEHRYVLRASLLPILGKPLSESNIKGRVYEMTIPFDYQKRWNVNKCQIIGFVHYYNATSKQVLNVNEVKLK